MSRINFNIILAMLIVVLVISCTRDEIMLPVEPTPPVEPMDTMTMEPMGMDTMMMDTMMMDTMMMDTMRVNILPCRQLRSYAS